MKVKRRSTKPRQHADIISKMLLISVLTALLKVFIPEIGYEDVLMMFDSSVSLWNYLAKLKERLKKRGRKKCKKVK